MNQEANQHSASWPDATTLCDAQIVMSPHPSILPLEVLLSQCRITAHRRGGPGGQHRNKVSSAIMVLHEPTGISAEANERRDQTQNRAVAIDRIRLRLAVVLRTNTLKKSENEIEIAHRERWRNRPLKINESNHDHAAVLALILDDLHRAGGQPSLVAAQWSTSTTSVVQFVSMHPPALQLVNRWRSHHGRSVLR